MGKRHFGCGNLSEDQASCHIDKEDVKWIEDVEEVFEIAKPAASLMIIEIQQNKAWKSPELALADSGDGAVPRNKVDGGEVSEDV